MAITYNTVLNNLTYIFTTTGGGTVFSTNLASQTAFAYFSTLATVNDCLYFGHSSTSNLPADLTFNVGTALAGTGITGVWEYYSVNGWRAMHNITDNTNGFTVLGANRVVFPFQARHTTVSTGGVNGILGSMWIRYRLTAVGSITNGGANQTIRVQSGDGRINIDGYTDATPCTWTEVYNWIIANAPQIGATRLGTQIFKFDNCCFNIASRLKSNNEKIFFGNGANYGQKFGITYLESGTKIGTDGWSNASDYYICFNVDTAFTVTGTNTKIYGGRWDFFTNIVDGLTCSGAFFYYGLNNGEWIGVFAVSGGYFNVGTVNKCTVEGGIISAFPAPIYPTNLNISYAKGNIWSIYSLALRIPSVTYSLPTTAVFNWNQYGGENNIFDLVDPTPSLPSQTVAPRILARSLGTLGNLTKFFYYDTSAGSYTDYTTQVSDTTVDDVPISGDVGDIFYVLAQVSGNFTQPALTLTLTTQTNDYVYQWEYWNGTTWINLGTNVFDNTNNFTTNGVIYVGTPVAWASSTINGSTGYWIRFKILTVGTGTPKISRMQRRLQTGIGNWRINEKYTTDLTITDKNGNVISGAVVTLTDSLGAITNLTTNVNGKIATTEFISKYAYFDKSVSETNFNVNVQNLNPYTIKVTKNGYETYQEKSNITSKINKVIAIKPSISYGFRK